MIADVPYSRAIAIASFSRFELDSVQSRVLA
jgi:hypothetical protein